VMTAPPATTTSSQSAVSSTGASGVGLTQPSAWGMTTYPPVTARSATSLDTATTIPHRTTGSIGTKTVTVRSSPAQRTETESKTATAALGVTFAPTPIPSTFGNEKPTPNGGSKESSKAGDAADGKRAQVAVIGGVVGGVCLILGVLASVWLVQRRNHERSEIMLSTSGPLGIPESGNVLYQQAIVRDIYGRGDIARTAQTVEGARGAPGSSSYVESESAAGSSVGQAPRHTFSDDASSYFSV
jgi:hypothetical protein